MQWRDSVLRKKMVISVHICDSMPQSKFVYLCLQHACPSGMSGLVNIRMHVRVVCVSLFVEMKGASKLTENSVCVGAYYGFYIFRQHIQSAL
jgi:hypothetical protein